MNGRKAKLLRSMCKDLKSDRRFAYKEAKKDFTVTPAKDRHLFTIFE